MTERALASGQVITAAVSEEEIMAKATPKSLRAGSPAWSRSQLAEWGVPWPPPSGWKAALVANYREQAGLPAAVGDHSEANEPGFHPMLPPNTDPSAQDFSTMDPVLRARWVQIIEGAKCRDDALALLCVPRRVMNDFAAKCMPEYRWPDSRPGEQRRQDFLDRRAKRLAQESAE